MRIRAEGPTEAIYIYCKKNNMEALDTAQYSIHWSGRVKHPKYFWINKIDS